VIVPMDSCCIFLRETRYENHGKSTTDLSLNRKIRVYETAGTRDAVYLCIDGTKGYRTVLMFRKNMS